MPRPAARRAIGVSVLLAGALGCQSPLSIDELNQLARAQHRWALRGFSNYSIETRTACFCPPEVASWARIDVIDGAVHRAVILHSGEVITDERLHYWSTVEQLFASIREANDSDYLSDLEVSFDPLLGFPTTVNWITDDDVLDGGARQSLRNAQPLP